MFSKFLFASVASLGLLVPAAAPATAVANEHHHHHCYHVYVRPSCHCAWECVGEFHHRHKAEHVAERYRCKGYEVMIRS